MAVLFVLSAASFAYRHLPAFLLNRNFRRAFFAKEKNL